MKTTKTQLTDHESTNKTEEAVTGTVGKWTASSTKLDTSVAVYPTTDEHGDGTAVTTNYAVVNYDTAGNNATNLTNGWDKSDSDRDFSKAMLFIPQELNAATVTEGTVLANDKTNPYFVLNCKIWNVNGATFDKTKDVCIYSGDAYIPVSVKWEPGKKYIYTFVFGGRNGGYDDNGKDVLVPISFTVTVDDFTPIVEKDVNMFQ